MASQQVGAQFDTVNSVMTGWVVTIPQSDSLLKARDLMTHRGVSQIIAVDEKKRPVGLVSKRDLARFLLEESTSRGLEDVPVSEAMSKFIPTIRENLPVLNAARMFDTENLACSIVTDDYPFFGIVTETDLCNYFSRKLPDTFKVNDFMSRDFIFAKTTYPVVHVAQAIVFKQPSVPVIDDNLVGILTLSDILSIGEKRHSSKHRSLIFNSTTKNEAALLTTEDLMTRNPITAKQDDDLAQAAQMIVRKGIGSLPVLDYQGTVVGLLSKHDIVKALGRVGQSLNMQMH
ncbi:MAG TPA: CBS domain-containing protein [Candidatus Bathyarchaeia archaeon]|nr:CBS domain-containing protein [Candidatus Bathyarchaeia archaeon]